MTMHPCCIDSIALELRTALQRYEALHRRPRSQWAWSAIAHRLWLALRDATAAGIVPRDGERWRSIDARVTDARQLTEHCARIGGQAS